MSIQPETLRVTGTQMGGQPLTLSLPQPKLGPVVDMRHDVQGVRRALPDEKLTVEMRLENDVLVVHFTAAEAGSFTWPTLRSDASVRAYILPLFEGLYIPVNDAKSADFLVRQGAISTTDGLSMPFWGLDCRGSSLTYIATNPFNNEIAFRQDGGKLVSEFTHTFTPNHKLKTYGLRICLGGNSPVDPAKIYRDYLVGLGQLVSMKEKIGRTPDAAKLLGAAFVYLRGEGLVTRYDFVDVKRLAARIIADSNASVPSVGKHLWTQTKKVSVRRGQMPAASNAHGGGLVRLPTRRSPSTQDSQGTPRALAPSAPCSVE